VLGRQSSTEKHPFSWICCLASKSVQLRRIKKPRAVKNRKNLDKVFAHAVYDAIAAQNDLSKQRIVDLWNNATGFGKFSQTIHSVKNVQDEEA